MTIIEKFEPDKQKNGFSKKYACLVAAGLFILIVVEIWASNNVVEYGGKLEKLSLLSKRLNTENQLLKNEIASSESLNFVASKSAELGFSPPESIQYIR
ncbi:hypothetical protein KKE78_00750 [Patescibacteria group bacterium]|nr:hypothetical protein [Patescibacteria group bacterium]